jgi:hypothetical protein
MTAVRTLLVSERTIAPDGRVRHLESLVARRDHCHAAGAHFWAFEHVAEPGRFLEFVEVREPALLDRLALDAPGSTRWQSVELG